jgi:hypothetical protein
MSNPWQPLAALVRTWQLRQSLAILCRHSELLAVLERTGQPMPVHTSPRQRLVAFCSPWKIPGCPFQPLVSLSSHLPAWAGQDILWPSMANLGSFLVVFCSPWHALAIQDAQVRPRQPSAAFGSSWLSFAALGKPRHPLTIFGSLWWPKAVFGSQLHLLAAIGSILQPMQLLSSPCNPGRILAALSSP